MQNFVYHAPTEIVFGKETENEVGKLCKKYGGTRVFVIYGSKSAKESGLVDRVEKAVVSEGLEVASMGGVVANPILSTAENILKAARDFKADFLLAVGGGSVIDTTKAVAHGLASDDATIWDFWLGTPIKKSTPFGSVLTISAAGSETSDSAVITNDLIDPPSKRGVNTPFNRGQFTVMNPELTMTLPAYQIGAGVADIMMHTLERFFAKYLGNHLTDEFAAGLIRNVIKYGPVGVADPNDYEAMSEIMWSSSVSHVGLTGAGSKGDSPRDGDWACHQLGMAVSAVYDSTHGATLTAVWGAWARFVCNENINRFEEFGQMIFGVNEAKEAIAKMEEVFVKLGMPINLTELLGHEPTDDEIETLVDVCTYNYKRTIGSFKVLDKDDIKQIYINCRR